jgi:DNA-binding CsgD family transcriptional regulator
MPNMRARHIPIDLSKLQQADPAPESAAACDLAHRSRIVGLAGRRSTPQFLVCDREMKPLFSSSGLDGATFPTANLTLLASACRRSRKGRTELIEALDDNTVCRIVPLTGELLGCVAIFVESSGHRNPIFEAAKTFGLTRRETEVLRLLVSGKSTSDISEALYVAVSTAGDHVKSIMRKSRCSSRVEIVTKVFNSEHHFDAASVALEGLS